MSGKSKLVYFLLVLIFAFTSLAAGAAVTVELAAAHDAYGDTAYHVDTQLGSPSFIIAGECDVNAPLCGGGA